MNHVLINPSKVQIEGANADACAAECARMVHISILGIGYVGAVSAACLARDGHRVVAVDVNPEKVASLAAGRSPIVEPGLDRLVVEQAQNHRLMATMDLDAAISKSEITFICVGTPSKRNGSLDLSFVLRAIEQAGSVLGH